MLKLLLILALLVSSCSRSPLDGLEFTSLNGELYKLSEIQRDKTIVYVWSGTCVGHIDDLRAINSVYPNLSEGVTLISIAIMMDEKDIRKVLEENKINPVFPILADPTGEFSEKVTLIFLPATLIFDKRGHLIGNYPKFPKDLVLKKINYNLR